MKEVKTGPNDSSEATFVFMEYDRSLKRFHATSFFLPLLKRLQNQRFFHVMDKIVMQNLKAD